MADNTEKFAAAVTKANYGDLPSEVVHESKRALLDSIGCAVAGLSMRASIIAVELAKRLGGPGEASIIGTGYRVASVNAAFANAQLINAQDFDPGSVLHDTPAVIAGALAVAETVKAPGKDLILAIALGHELATRLKSAEGPGLMTEGFAAVTLAVAASVGRLLHLNPEQMRNAVGIASFIHPPNTVRRYFNTSPVWMTKYTVFGPIAQAGVTAALLAQMGFTGDREALDGDYASWKPTGERVWDADKVTDGLGVEWTHSMGYKRYPSNLPSAGAKDCFIDIIEKHHIQPDEIEKITIRMSPLWKHRSIRDNRLQTEEDYIFNVPYQLACAAYRINPTRWLDPDVRRDPKLQAFMQRVTFDIGCDERAFELAKRADPSANLMSAEVVSSRGTFKKQSLQNKGRSRPAECRMTDEELVDKFKENVSKVFSSDAATKAVRAVFDLEKAANVAALMEVLAP